MSKPKRFIIFHVAPGLVNYAGENGREELVLVRKEALDRMNQSFVGKPVFNETHKMIDAETAFDLESSNIEELADGIVHAVGYDEYNGQHWVEVMIWDASTLQNIADGYGVSNAYTVKAYGPGGTHNSVPYSAEVLDGEYLHLAVVKNPRYSDTKIIANSKDKEGGVMNKLFKFLGGKPKEEKPKEEVKTNSVDMPADAALEVDGDKIPVADMLSAYKAVKKNEADEKAKEEATVNMDDSIEVDGEKIPVKELLAAWKASKKNEGDKDDDKDEKAKEDAKTNAAPEAKNANFKVLANAAAKTEETKTPEVDTVSKGLVRGKARYGSAVVVEVKEGSNA